jgi:hypothetical protein
MCIDRQPFFKAQGSMYVNGWINGKENIQLVKDRVVSKGRFVPEHCWSCGCARIEESSKKGRRRPWPAPPPPQ